MDKGDKQTQLRSVSDLFAYKVSFKFVYNYKHYLMTKNQYVYVINIFTVHQREMKKSGNDQEQPFI